VTEGKKRQETLVTEKGHLLARKRLPTGDPMNTSFQRNLPPVGKVGYDFTTMSYISFQLRALEPCDCRTCHNVV